MAKFLVLSEMRYMILFKSIYLCRQKLHNRLSNRISSSRILSMVRPSLEAGLMRWVNLQKDGERPYSIVLVCSAGCCFYCAILCIY